MIEFNLYHEYLSPHGAANKKLEELRELGIEVLELYIVNKTLVVKLSKEDEFFLTLAND